MSELSIREAINQVLHQEMARDERVVVMGEDVANRENGGVYGITAGLADRFGERRVIDTPITESAIIGAAGGAALTGLRPVAELMFIDFLGVCLDQLMNQIAKFRYMFGGRASTPVTIRTMIGAGAGTGPQHSAILYPLLVSIPGIKVAAPSNAYDAKGLLTQAIRDDDPVVFCEHKAIYTGHLRLVHVLDLPVLLDRPAAHRLLPDRLRALRGARGGLHDSLRSGAHGVRGHGCHGGRVLPHGAAGGAGGPDPRR